MSARSQNFITTAELAETLSAPDVVVVDASWYLPMASRDAHGEYLAGHIPGAVFFDIDTIADPSSGLPHMLPTAEAFGGAIGALGITEDMRIVVYDGLGLFSAPRVWWTFKTFGVRDVRVLEGGLPQWKAEERPLETGAPVRTQRPFAPRLNSARVADAAEVKAALDDGLAQVVDARSAERFAGWAPEPRAGLRAGHMPGSRNLPFQDVVAGGRLKSADDLRDTFQNAGIDVEKPLITSCGSGVTAAVLTLALAEIGQTSRLYDGSWTEWGGRPDLPVATKPKP